jgi:hypothetical protein
MKFPARVMREKRCYKSLITQLADLVPCNPCSAMRCEQMLQITNHTANIPSSMQFPAV